MKEINEIKPFTYKDYIYYKMIFQQNKYEKSLMLCDVGEEYNYKKEINNPHDKIFKDVLDDKKEVVTFINERLKLENTPYALQERDLEKYNREFITEDFKSVESDVIYKKKDQKIFFLIEQQSTIDYAMVYRILKYNMAILESAIEKEKLRQKDYKLPTIFTFVIYTGNKKWNASNDLIAKQEKLAGCKLRTFANFQLIDVNEYTKEDLLESESLLTKMMLLEKAENYEELEDYLQLIVEKEMVDSQKIFLQRLIKYVFNHKLNNQKFDKFMKELQLKQEKGGNSMFVEIISKKIDEVFEMEEKVKEKETKVKEQESKVKEQESKVKEQESKVKEQESKIKEREKKVQKEKKEIKQKEININKREKAVTKAENQMIINMIKNNIDESMILKIVNIDKDKLDKLKKEMMVM